MALFFCHLFRLTFRDLLLYFYFNKNKFDHFKGEAGLHTFTLSAKEWIEKTNAVGIYAQAGRYGGTYATKILPLSSVPQSARYSSCTYWKNTKGLKMRRMTGLNWNGVPSGSFQRTTIWSIQMPWKIMSCRKATTQRTLSGCIRWWSWSTECGSVWLYCKGMAWCKSGFCEKQQYPGLRINRRTNSSF